MVAKKSDGAAPPATQAAERLRNAVQAAAMHNPNSIEDVRAAVTEFTRALREKGETPEGVLIAIRAIIGSRIFLDNGQVVADVPGHRLHERISTWSIKAYFGENSA